MNAQLAQIPLADRLKLSETIKTPALFAKRLLRVDPWTIQRKIMEAVAVPQSRTNVKACHASGKTWTASSCALHALARYQESIVITTAPTENQVKSILWPEIHASVARSIYPFPKPLTTELRMAPKRYALGFTTTITKGDEGVKFQGFHAEHILFILDEAPGVDPRIWAAIEGARAGGDVRILGLGNPTIAGGLFYDTFHKLRDSWGTFTISAFDTPNLENCSLQWRDSETGEEIRFGSGKSLLDMSDEELDRNVRPYLTTRRWVLEKFKEWGPESPLFEARVLGQFPKHNEYTLISLSSVERCSRISDSVDSDVPFRAGIDVAGPGEAESTLVVRQGRRIVLLKGYAEQDPRGPVMADLKPFKDSGKLENVCIDSIGIGWNFALHFRDNDYPVTMVNVQNAPDTCKKDTELYKDKKAQYYWHLRQEFLGERILGLHDERTIAQLTTMRYSHGPKGHITIESKDDLKKRGVQSPDRAEGLMLAFCPARAPWAGLSDYYENEQAESTQLNLLTNSPDIGQEIMAAGATPLQ